MLKEAALLGAGGLCCPAATLNFKTGKSEKNG